MTTTMYLLLCLCFALTILDEGDARPFALRPYPLSLTRKFDSTTNNKVEGLGASLTCRGGASLVDDEYDEDVDESDVEESDDDDEEEKEAPKSKLSSSAMKATAKSQAKKTATAKKAVNAGLADAKPATQIKKSSKLRIPYILKACMNPLTVFAMTKAYFQSLFNLDYAKKEPSQDLRSALEEKAKKAASGGARGRRKMKPGQAKTLSDLPQLNT